MCFLDVLSSFTSILHYVVTEKKKTVKSHDFNEIRIKVVY